MKNKVNIIGAGIAGLSAGAYLQMNGYETEIFELHNSPGGFCTSWQRKGYTFDGCIHWLVGSSPGDNFYNLWNELVDIKSLKFIDQDIYITVEDSSGKSIRVFTDIDRLEKEMVDKAPEDKALILEFVNAVRKFTGMNMPIEKASEIMSPLDGLKMLARFFPYLRDMKKWIRISAKEYAARCKNELLKKTFLHMFIPEMAVLFLIMTLVWMHKKSAGYPIGGSLNFSKLIEKRYLDLGGKINYNSRVVKILTDNDSAKGILLENGEPYVSDIVISAADGHFTIFDMLEGKYIDNTIKRYYDNYPTFPSYIQVSLGISRKLDNEPHSLVFELEHPVIIDDSTLYNYCAPRIFNFDPTMAPKGKSVIIVRYGTKNYEYWDNLKREDIKRYKSEKNRIAKDVIKILDKRFGNIKSRVEAIDVSTPSTVIRYTNNWKGSFEGWVMTPELGLKEMKKTLPGLSDFYMAGQWVMPGGGLPSAILCGRNVTQMICRKDKKKFVTQEA